MTPEPQTAQENQLPNSPSASEDHSSPSSGPKRKASNAGLGAASSNGRPVKRRASKACQCCRARKVRCNVVEHGAPCTNCRLDEVPCVVTESKRRKKHSYHNMKPPSDPSMAHPQHLHNHMRPGMTLPDALASGSVNPHDISNFHSSGHSVSSSNEQDDDNSSHVPHTLYQNRMTNLEAIAMNRANRYPTLSLPINFNTLINSAAIGGDLHATRVHGSPPPIPMASMARPQTIPQVNTPQATHSSIQTNPQAPPTPRQQYGILPAYIKPLPPRMAMEDVAHLSRKGALAIPPQEFRNELLRAYIEFVHPYMPLIELHELLSIVNLGTGETGKISLLLFQAIMFAGVAFVDMSYLTKAGYPTRKSARKAFYLKARALYDFDYESDRVAIVQALLLMTYWYETPDDQKDTWHWMGVAISLAHTIGLHRNPANSVMSPQKQKLWKRIWWSCFMRDRLVALGMRRPTRIKDADFDVPMLTLDDFEIKELEQGNNVISQRCRMIRELRMQEDLAHLCIAKAKLCLCISHVLSAQYSVLVRDQGQAMGQEGNTRSSVMLFPKKLDQTDEVKVCDEELVDWISTLPAQCLYGNPSKEDLEAEIARGGSTVVVQRALLHMCYYATLSALHRPQVLPSFENANLSSSTNLNRARDLQDLSRRKVREASREITAMSQSIHQLNLTQYLPTTGVTVLLPAIIIHLLDIKSFEKEQRGRALRGFGECMAVLEGLRVNYAAADFAGQFLDAAIRKAGIDVGNTKLNNITASARREGMGMTNNGGVFKVPEVKNPLSASHALNQQLNEAARLTPPPDTSLHTLTSFAFPQQGGGVEAIEQKLFDESNNDNPATNAFVSPGSAGATPPRSENFSGQSNASDNSSTSHHQTDIPNPIYQPMEGVQSDRDVAAALVEQVNQGFDDAFDALINFDHDENLNSFQDWVNPGHAGDVNGTSGMGAGMANIEVGGINGGMEMGIHGESGGFLVDVDCVWQTGEEGVGFQWTAGSPQNGDGQQQNVQSEQQNVQSGQQQDVIMENNIHGGIQLSDEERAVFLLKDGITA